MKKLSLILLLLAVASLSHAQRVRRVNNTPGLNDPNVYASAQAANDAAVDGDTIYFEPAGGSDGVNYGSVTINKKLTLIGPGYLLDKNPNTSFDKRLVRLGNVVFENGSTTSKIMGLTTGTIEIKDSLISITRCIIENILVGQSNIPVYGLYSKGRSATITNCIFYTISSDNVNNSYSQNHTISNNIFIALWYNGVSINNLNLSVIKNNTFYRVPGSATIGDVRNSTIFNNIFDARDAVAGSTILSPAATGNTVSNNICLGISGLPSGSGNVNSANPNTVFKIQHPYGQSSFWDDNYKLATNSPAKTVGVGGTEAGAFGGNTPYVLSGVPAVPVVTSFTSTGSGNTSTPLSVTISVRSAN